MKMNLHECECRPNDSDFEGRTYLYIRTHPDDNGAEPRPADMICVVSPDIIVIQPDGSRGATAVAGQKNQIEVIVTNDGGITANDAYVEVFYGGSTTGFIATTAQKIGGTYVTVEGYSTNSVRVPWIPSVSGHYCLTARVSLVVPPDTYQDPDCFDVPQDRHLAQRNIHIVELHGEAGFKFDFDLVNPGVDNSGELLLQVQFINAAGMEGTINQALGTRFVRLADHLFGQVNITINGIEPRLNEPGLYSIYLPKREVMKAQLHVQKSRGMENLVGGLHLLEVRLLEYNGNEIKRVIGGLWIVVKE